MITVSSAFKQAISNDEKIYLTYADITLSNGHVLNLTNEELWEGGYTREEAVSDDNKFTALGATIIGSAELSIKNQNEEYSSYDFTNAKVKTYIALEGVANSKFQTGTYTVDEAQYTEASIRLTMLDNMEQFDRPYSKSSLAYPATLLAIVQNLCLVCGVTLSTTTFPHYNFSIPERPMDEGITCREVLGMAAAIAGCYCRCTPDGKLQLTWFDRSTLDAWRAAYRRGSTTPGSSYTGMHYFTSLYSQDISVDDIVITGVRCIVEKPDREGKTQSYTYTSGSTGYVIGVEKNELLNACTEAQIQQVTSWLGTQLNGLTFRKVNVSHSSDPTIESGDIAAVWDRRDRGYPILVTRTNFSAFEMQKTVCGAETPSRNAATRYGWQTKSYVESKKQLNAEQSLREQIEKELRDAIENAAGLYLTKKTTDGATIYYLHNFPDLDNSPVRIMFSTAGISVTANGTATNPTWYGLTANGTMLVNLLRTTGFSFDWATGGTLTLGGQDNINGQLKILNASGTEIGRWDKDGIKANSGGKLTSKNGKVYVDLDNNEIACNKLISADTNFGVDVGSYNAFGGSSIDGIRLINKNYPNYGFYFRPASSQSGTNYIDTNTAFSLRAYNNSSETGFTPSHLGELNISDSGISFWMSRKVSGSSLTGLYGFSLAHSTGALNISTWGTINLNCNKAYYNNTEIAKESSSSIRYKHDIGPITDENLNSHRLLELPIVQFKWNDDHPLQYNDMRGKVVPGIIAEDVNRIYPSAVIHDDKGRIESWDERRIIPGMLSLIQEQHKKIEDLESRIARLESIIEKMSV